MFKLIRKDEREERYIWDNKISKDILENVFIYLLIIINKTPEVFAHHVSEIKFMVALNNLFVKLSWQTFVENDARNTKLKDGFTVEKPEDKPWK